VVGRKWTLAPEPGRELYVPRESSQRRSTPENEACGAARFVHSHTALYDCHAWDGGRHSPLPRVRDACHVVENCEV
jgi:hypothetical protein